MQLLSTRPAVALIMLLLTVGCDSSGRPLAPAGEITLVGTEPAHSGGSTGSTPATENPATAPTAPSAPPAAVPPPAPPPRAAHIQFSFEYLPPYLAGLELSFRVVAFDSAGQQIPSDKFAFELSDESIASVKSIREYQRTNPANLELWAYRNVSLKLLRPGEFTLSASFDGLTTSKTITVLGDFPTTSALTVESFTLVEYSPCATCGLVVYAPLIVLREPTGSATATVIGIELSAPSFNTRSCRGPKVYAPGETRHLDVVDEYVHNNDLVFLNTNNQKMPDGIATARIYVRDAKGEIGFLSASAGPIVRNKTLADLPLGKNFPPWGSCYY